MERKLLMKNYGAKILKDYFGINFNKKFNVYSTEKQ